MNETAHHDGDYLETDVVYMFLSCWHFHHYTMELIRHRIHARDVLRVSFIIYRYLSIFRNQPDPSKPTTSLFVNPRS
jgi:hypothetical protein